MYYNQRMVELEIWSFPFLVLTRESMFSNLPCTQNEAYYNLTTDVLVKEPRVILMETVSPKRHYSTSTLKLDRFLRGQVWLRVQHLAYKENQEEWYI